MALKTGDKAPNFSLFSSEKKIITLDDFKGSTLVILFFPLAFTSTCTKELCSVRDELSEYNSLSTNVIAISVDSLYTLAKYKEEQKFNFTLLSDFNKDISTAYGSIYELFSSGMKGVSKRSAFVIDKNGILQYAEVLENAGDIPNLVAVKAVLKELNR